MTERTPTIVLLERWRDGDDKALHQLLEEELPWIRGHVNKRLGPLLRQLGDAEDYVQEAMVRVLKSGPQFRVSDRRHFRALLAVLIENTLREEHRFHRRERRNPDRRKPLPRDSVLDLDPPRRGVTRPSVVAHREEEAAWMELAMALLPATDSEVVRLREWGELPFSEIGEAMGMKENTARARFHRALSKLAHNFVQLRAGGLGSVLAARDE